MSPRSMHQVAMALICLSPFAWVVLAIAQQAPPGASTGAPKAANTTAAPQSAAASDAARRAEILASDCWRRAMYERNEWLRVQSIYPPDEVARIKADFAARVDQMSAKELQLVLADLEAKFRILDSQEAREVRAWLGNYLSIISLRRRDELLETIPDFATMNSMQLQQTITRLAQRREARVRQQDAFQQVRNSGTNPWNQGNAPANRSAPRSGYRSPYRPQSFERPFDNVPAASRRGMTVSPDGLIWMNF